MLTIIDGRSLTRALSTSIDSRLKQLLSDRVRQLDAEDLSTVARFVIVEPGDSLKALEAELGFSVFQNPGDGTRFGDPDFTPGWEWIEDHGLTFELVFVFTDDGFAHVVLVENVKGVVPALLKLCGQYVTDQV